MSRYPGPLAGARLVLLFLAAWLTWPLAASAVTHEMRILMDLDEDAATGCTVTTVDGPFSGAEQALIATVETSSPPEVGMVSDLALSDCDPVSGTFGVPSSFDGGWPVGVGLGVAGRDLVESYVPLASLLVQDLSSLRLAVAVTDELGGEAALLTADGTPDGPAIVLSLASVVEIPTMSGWGALLLALLLVASALRTLSRRRKMAFLLVTCVAVASGLAWTAEGIGALVDDWSPGDVLGFNDAVVFFGKEEGALLWFRVDVDLRFDEPPVAADDAFSTDEDTAISGANVLVDNGSGPDSDPNGDPLSVTAFDPTSAQGVAVSVASDGDLTYDPAGVPALQALAAGATVDDTFSYTIEDPGGTPDSATVTVTVTGVNDAPTATGDGYSTDEDVRLAVPAPGLLDNDDDVDSGDTLTAVLDTDVSNGTLTLATDGSFTYDPDPDFHGTDGFTYHATDGTASSAIVTVTITVDPAGDPPIAEDDAFSTGEDTALSGANVLADNGSGADSDVDGDPLTVTAFDPASAQGVAVSVAAGGELTYDPTGVAALQALAAGATVDDTFSYTIEDPGGTPDSATVTVTVTGVNDEPTATGDAYSTDEDVQLAVPAPGVLDNDDDVDSGDTLTAVLDTDVSNGTLTLADDGSFTYDPDPDFHGSDSFTYHATDGTASSAIVTVGITVDPAGDPPVARDDAFATGEDTALSGVNVLADNGSGADSDPDGDPLTVTAFDPASAQGVAVSVAPGGDLTYDPTSVPALQALAAGATVDDTFSYTIEDPGGTPDSATVTVTVTGANDPAANDPPSATGDGYTSDEDVQLAVPAPGVLGNDDDVDSGDTLTAVLDTGVSNGTLTLADDGSFTYDPDPDFHGSDSFTYHATDGTADSATVTVAITVDPVSDCPSDVVCVEDAGDTLDASPGDGVCADAAGACTLRAALQEVNARGGGETIWIDPELDTIYLTLGSLIVSSELILDGNDVTIDASTLVPRDRVLDVRIADSTTGTQIRNLTVTGGQTTGNGGGIKIGCPCQHSGALLLDGVHAIGNSAARGGGIYMGVTTVHIRNSTISANESTIIGGEHQSSGGGGGIYVWFNSNLTLEDSTISDNTANYSAGGITFFDNTATVRIHRSAISGNTVRFGSGGGIASLRTYDFLMTNSTLSGNIADFSEGGALWLKDDEHADAVAKLVNVTIADNTSEVSIRCQNLGLSIRGTVISTPPVPDWRDCGCFMTSLGHNVSSDTSCIMLTDPTDVVDVDPLLAPLADNGGPTLTHLPLPGSPLLDAIPVGTPVACDGTEPTDQRGETRPQSTGCDIGAVEVVDP